jgi:uncharacterized protein YbjT (DUF2867 family)
MEKMKINLIITGSTGMVGEAVLMECLNHPDVESILAINRRPCGFSDPKLSEIIHENFYDLSPVENKLAGFNACFFCLGLSSINKKEQEYYSLTYTLTIDFAKILVRLNPGMTFCYISGAGTDSSEKGKFMWARVKGKTENDLMKLAFKKVFAFRPGFLYASKGQKRVNKYYALFGFLYPVLRLIIPNYVSTLKELGLAMINSVTKGYEKQILEVPDIIKLSKE